MGNHIALNEFTQRVQVDGRNLSVEELYEALNEACGRDMGLQKIGRKLVNKYIALRSQRDINEWITFWRHLELAFFAVTLERCLERRTCWIWLEATVNPGWDKCGAQSVNIVRERDKTA